MLYWRDIKSSDPTLFIEFRTVFEKLLAGEYASADLDLKKRVGAKLPIWSVRANNTVRILLSQDAIGNAVVLEVLRTHDYHKSNFLRHDYAAAEAVAALQEGPCYDFLDETSWVPDVPVIPFKGDLDRHENVTYYKNQFISLSFAQRAVSGASFPIRVSGWSGSGKTVVAQDLIYQLIQQSTPVCDEEGKRRLPCIIYVSEQLPLVHTMHKSWINHPLVGDVACTVLFLTYEQFIFKMATDIAERQVVHWHTKNDTLKSFSQWFTDYCKQKHFKSQPLTCFHDHERVIEEFRIISGYDATDYIDGGGKKACLFHERPARQFLFDAFFAYQRYLDSLNSINFDVFAVEKKIICDYLFVDEVQQLTPRQFLNLMNGVEGNNVFLSGDVCQDGKGLIPNDEYIRQYFFKQSIQLTEIQLEQLFRSGKRIQAFATHIFYQMQCATGGVMRREEAKTAMSCPDGLHEGAVFFIDDYRTLSEPLTDVMVITSDAYLLEARKYCKGMPVTTVTEVAGMEFKQVLLYRLFDSPSWAEANLALQRHQERVPTGHRYKKGAEALAKLECLFRTLYMAVGRAMDCLFIFEKPAIQSQLYTNLKRFMDMETHASPCVMVPNVSASPAAGAPDVYWLSCAEEFSNRLNFDAVYDILSNRVGYDRGLIRGFWQSKQDECCLLGNAQHATRIADYLLELDKKEEPKPVEKENKRLAGVGNALIAIAETGSLFNKSSKQLTPECLGTLLHSDSAMQDFLSWYPNSSPKIKKQCIHAFLLKRPSGPSLFELFCSEDQGLVFIKALIEDDPTWLKKVTSGHLKSVVGNAFEANTVLCHLTHINNVDGLFVLTSLLNINPSALEKAPWLSFDEQGSLIIFNLLFDTAGYQFFTELLLYFPTLFNQISSKAWNTPLSREDGVPALFYFVVQLISDRHDVTIVSQRDNKRPLSAGLQSLFNADWSTPYSIDKLFQNCSPFNLLTLTPHGQQHLNAFLSIYPPFIEKLNLASFVSKIDSSLQNILNTSSPLGNVLSTKTGHLLFNTLMTLNPHLILDIPPATWFELYVALDDTSHFPLLDLLQTNVGKAIFLAVLEKKPAFLWAISPDKWMQPFEYWNDGEKKTATILLFLNRDAIGQKILFKLCELDERIASVAFQSLGYSFRRVSIPSTEAGMASFFSRVDLSGEPSAFELLTTQVHCVALLKELATQAALVRSFITFSTFDAVVIGSDGKRLSVIERLLQQDAGVEFFQALYANDKSFIIQLLSQSDFKWLLQLCDTLTGYQFLNKLLAEFPAIWSDIPIKTWVTPVDSLSLPPIAILTQLIAVKVDEPMSLLEKIIRTEAAPALKDHLKTLDWFTCFDVPTHGFNGFSLFWGLTYIEKGFDLFLHLFEGDTSFEASITADVFNTRIRSENNPYYNISLLKNILSHAKGRAFFLRLVTRQPMLLTEIGIDAWLLSPSDDMDRMDFPLCCLCFGDEAQAIFSKLIRINPDFVQKIPAKTWFKTREMSIGELSYHVNLRQLIGSTARKSTLFNQLCSINKEIVQYATANPCHSRFFNIAPLIGSEARKSTLFNQLCSINKEIAQYATANSSHSRFFNIAPLPTLPVVSFDVSSDEPSLGGGI